MQRFYSPLFLSLLATGILFGTSILYPGLLEVYDSYYHIAMAEMIGNGTLLHQFPWMYFTTLRDTFVNHHVLFQGLLFPFILFGKWIQSHGIITEWGDILGSKIAMSLFGGFTFFSFFTLLKSQHVRLHWLWIIVIFLLPAEFLVKYHVIRAPALALSLMFLGIWATWTRHYIILFLISFLNVWLYGGFFFLPIILMIHTIVIFFQEKKVELFPLLLCLLGSVVGLITHPYFPELLPFLKTQLLDTGLGAGPSLNSGQEWLPLNTWDFMKNAAIPLTLLILAMTQRLTQGKKIDHQSLTLLFITLFFMLLSMKSQRFFEYWPLWALATAGMFTKFELQRLVIDTRGILSIVLFVLVGSFGMILFQTTYMGIPWNLYFTEAQMLWIIQHKALVTGSGIIIMLWCGWYYAKKIIFSSLSIEQGFFEGMCAVLVVVCLAHLAIISQQFSSLAAENNEEFLSAKAIVACLDKEVPKQSIVFQSQWDQFPLYFYLTKDFYSTGGLDPIFQYLFDKQLYKTYQNIVMNGDNDHLYEHIKNDFKAKAIIAKKYYPTFIKNLDADPAHFERICSTTFFKAYLVK